MSGIGLRSYKHWKKLHKYLKKRKKKKIRQFKEIPNCCTVQVWINSLDYTGMYSFCEGRTMSLFNVPLNEKLKLGLNTQLRDTGKTKRTLCHHEPKAIWTVDWGIHTKEPLIQFSVSLKELTDIMELMTLKQKQWSQNICLGNEEK